MAVSKPKAPFQVKGLVYQAAVEFYDQALPGGSEALRARLKGVEAEFFSQRFLAGSLYDLLPILPISAEAAAIARLSQQELVRRNAEWTAHRDINGIYRMLLRLASPKMVAMMLPKASMQYFAFGSAAGQVNGNQLDAQQKGIPRVLADWMVWCVEGFAPVALTLAGAKEVSVSKPSVPEATGNIEGHPVCDLAWQIRWE